MDNNVSNVGILIGLGAFYLAYYQWIKGLRDKRFHLLKVLEKQLECLGVWIGEPGYESSLTTEQKFDNVDPFKRIYNTATESLIGITAMESISDVPANIIGEINELYYDLVRISNGQQLRNDIVSSYSQVAMSLCIKRENYILNNGSYDFNIFLSTLSSDELRIVSLLLPISENIHCNVIGNVDKGACRHRRFVKDWVESQKAVRFDLPFIALTLLASFLFLYFITQIFSFLRIDMYAWIVLSLITIIFSLSNRAISWSLD